MPVLTEDANLTLGLLFFAYIGYVKFKYGIYKGFLNGNYFKSLNDSQKGYFLSYNLYEIGSATLNGLMVASIFLFWANSRDIDNRYWYAVMGLFAGAFYSIKKWPYVFFVERKFRKALLYIGWAMAISIVIAVLMAVETQWLQFGLWIPIPIALVYPLYVSWVFSDKYLFPFLINETQMQPVRTRNKGYASSPLINQ